MAAGMVEALGVSYTEAMAMRLDEALKANLNALAMSRKRAEQLEKERR